MCINWNIFFWLGNVFSVSFTQQKPWLLGKKQYLNNYNKSPLFMTRFYHYQTNVNYHSTLSSLRLLTTDKHTRKANMTSNHNIPKTLNTQCDINQSFGIFNYEDIWWQFHATHVIFTCFMSFLHLYLSVECHLYIIFRLNMKNLHVEYETNVHLYHEIF